MMMTVDSVNTLKGIFDGRQELEFGWAIVYTVTIFCSTLYFKQRWFNEKIKTYRTGY